jgi:hypothetical protein
MASLMEKIVSLNYIDEAVCGIELDDTSHARQDRISGSGQFSNTKFGKNRGHKR